MMHTSIIDVDTYIGHFPFRKLFYNTAEGLAHLAKQNEITTLCVASLDAIFYRNSQDGNEELLAELKAFSQKDTSIQFLPFAVINPHYTGYLKDIETCHQHGFCGIELFPLYHGYRLGDQESVAAVTFAKELGMPVRIRAGFEDTRQRHDMDVVGNVCPQSVVDLILKVPDANYILTGFDATEIYPFIHENKHVFFSTWKTDIYPAINSSFLDTLAVVPVSQLVLGTNAPLSYMEPEFVRLLNCHALSDEDKENILSHNVKPIL